MSNSRSENEAFNSGQSDGALGNRDHQPTGGFVDTVLNRPDRDCDNDVREAAYNRGHAIGKASRK